MLLTLLLAQCIEPNPGPQSQRGTSGRARGANRSRGRGRGFGRGTDIFNEGQDDIVSTRRSARLQSTQNERNSISSWLSGGQIQGPVTQGINEHLSASRLETGQNRNENNAIDNNEFDSIASDVNSDTDRLSGQIDTNQIMLETHQMVKGLNRKFDHLQKSVNDLKKG